MSPVDLNCDMGESYGRFKVGNDEAVFPFISSSNIACGFHGGDPLHIEQTIKMAMLHKVRIGAHPSYPDLAGFGRRYMTIEADELRAIIKYQISAVKGLVESYNGQLAYVKPHGALYNTAAQDQKVAMTVLKAIQEIDPELHLMGLAGSPIQELAQSLGIPFIAEAFADRMYEPNGQLRARSQPNSVISDPDQAARQVLSIIQKKQVISIDEKPVSVNAQSFCIHGDNPSAVPILQAIHRSFKANGIQLINNT